jgi:hypothetical protein
MDPVHTLSFCFFNIHFNIIFQCTLQLYLPAGLHLSGFPNEVFHAFPLSAFHGAKCLSHLTLLHFVSLMLFCERYKLLCSSLCSFYLRAATSAFLNTNILLIILFSNAFYPSPVITERRGQVVNTPDCIREVPGSNLGFDTGYPTWGFCWPSSVPQASALIGL